MAELNPQSAGDFEAQLRAEAAGLGLIPPLTPLELARSARPQNYLAAAAKEPQATYRAQSTHPKT
jgi:hypothetical protein